ncbi:MAG: DUF4867 family protein [Candidatus Humimicrobiaceae bacterium]
MEDILKELDKLNPERNIVSVFDDSFKKFGMVHKGFKTDALMNYIKHNNIVEDEIVYTADVPEMRKEIADQLNPIMVSVYAGMEVQVGVCYGRNSTLNALEYHNGSEVYIVGADWVMMLGLDEDIKWPEGTYDSSLIKNFYAPKGSIIELRGGCMHYAATNVYKEEGFSVIVSLLKDTNTKIDFQVGNQYRDKLIIAKNTWLLAHPEYEPAKKEGWHLGITGENFSFKTL